MKNIEFFGRNFLLIKANEYRLLVDFIEFFNITNEKFKFLNSMVFEQNKIIEIENLNYGLVNNQEDFIKTYPVRLFWEWKDNFYPIHRGEKNCSHCNENFISYVARSHDLYWGLSNIDQAYQWSLDLPFIACCPNCGYVEPLQQKFLATIYQDKVSTNL